MIGRLFARIADAFRWPDLDPPEHTLYGALLQARMFVADELAIRGPLDELHERSAADTLRVIDMALDAEDARRMALTTAIQQASL